VELLNVAVSSPTLLPLITTVPPCTTSTSVDWSKRNLTNWSEIGSICKFCTLAGKAVLPKVSKLTEEVVELITPKALIDLTLNVYWPSSDSFNVKSGLVTLNVCGLSSGPSNSK